MSRLTAVAIVLVLSGGCVTTDSTDATRDPDFFITESQNLDEPHEPLGFVFVEKTGWYLFASLPVFPVTLDGLVWDNLVPEAKKRGANGIISLKYSISPASFWRFSLLGALPVPDWGSKGTVTGMAVRIKKAGARR